MVMTFPDRIAHVRATATALSPRDAATRWTAGFRKTLAMDATDVGGGMQVGFVTDADGNHLGFTQSPA